MKFLVDMNLSPRWVAFLVKAGFEAVHWSEIGPIDASDSEDGLGAAAWLYRAPTTWISGPFWPRPSVLSRASS